jgi:hypothetical protein
MSGATPPFRQCASMAWCSVKSTGTTLHFTFYSAFKMSNISNISKYVLSSHTHTKLSSVMDSSVGVATGYGLDDRIIGVHFPAGDWNFSLRHRVQTGSGAHPVSYPMDTGALYLGVKRPGTEADHSLPSSVEVKECVELYLHSSNTSSWRDA